MRIRNIFFVILVFWGSLRGFCQANYDREKDHHDFTIFMSDGGWCWFQDPRGIISNNQLVMGAVQGNGSGGAYVGVYNLKKGKATGKFLLHEEFDHDDHNAPVFFKRDDGSLLTFYARHSREMKHYYRISDKKNYLKWGDEKVFEHDYPTADKVTYMNLYYLKNEEKLYNFFRGINYNPSFITSKDQGETWGEPTHLIIDEVDGRNRPYARYFGDGLETIHIGFTDAHPRDFGNSIYYAAFREGKFYHANGELIKSLEEDGPLKPSEADLIFKGSGESQDVHALSVPLSAWTSSISLDEKGYPHIGYTLYLSNDDHRYRIASWDGEKWIDREVAYGGKCLYPRESSYTGLITLDPEDPNYVIISTDVDPKTGNDMGGKHEIYRARIGLDDDIKTIRWEALTSNSPVRNIRPIITRDNSIRVITWLRGDFNAYTDYDLDVVGVIENIHK